MEIMTERMRLREVYMDDLEVIHDLHAMPETDRYNTLGIPKSIEVTQQLLMEWLNAQQELPRKKYVLWIENTEGNFVGLMGINLGKPNYFNAEFWYKLHPEQWSKGYATEAVKCSLDFCFRELKLHRITAGCAVQNVASLKVLQKSGFIKEAHHRKILPIRGEWVDNYEFAILEEDYFKINP